MDLTLEFERPIVELEKRISELAHVQGGPDIQDELARLQKKVDRMRVEVFSRLSVWQRVQLSRHPQRPYVYDYIPRLFDTFCELHGDRLGADDPAIAAGFGLLGGKLTFLIGQQKGRTTKEKSARHFGMPMPDGYRKALRVAFLAQRFGAQLLCLIDTPGAYPGIEAEQRGQAEAIARNIEEFSQLPIPIVAVVIGEGGSGGALAIGVSDRVFMQEFSTYSVISPEGCASILWRDASYAQTAAEALKITAPEVFEMGLIDGIISEPAGGAHRDPAQAAVLLKETVVRAFEELSSIPAGELPNLRLQKFQNMGKYEKEA